MIAGPDERPEPLTKLVCGVRKAIIALPSVVLMMMFGQTRIFFVMARDGLIPAKLARVSSRGTPVRITIFTAAAMSVVAGIPTRRFRTRLIAMAARRGIAEPVGGPGMRGFVHGQ